VHTLYIGLVEMNCRTSKKGDKDTGKYLMCSAGCQQISSMGGWQW